VGDIALRSSNDPVVRELGELVSAEPARATIRATLDRVLQQLAASGDLMAWEVVPLEVFGDRLPPSIRSCWIFAIRPNADTGAERHPNSHQRSLSLFGRGSFELRVGGNWNVHPLTSADDSPIDDRWVSIPPSTWHRLFVGSGPWGMVSFHTVVPQELIEERPAKTGDLDGETHQERYVG
jgi:hypothetical protein